LLAIQGHDVRRNARSAGLRLGTPICRIAWLTASIPIGRATFSPEFVVQSLG
jgi:hypothetical protein